jgi:hypothetical protein
MCGCICRSLLLRLHFHSYKLNTSIKLTTLFVEKVFFGENETIFAYLQFGKLFSLVARRLSIDEFGEKEFLKIRSFVKNWRIGKWRSKERDIISCGDIYFVSANKELCK